MVKLYLNYLQLLVKALRLRDFGYYGILDNDNMTMLEMRGHSLGFIAYMYFCNISLTSYLPRIVI